MRLMQHSRGRGARTKPSQAGFSARLENSRKIG